MSDTRTVEPLTGLIESAVRDSSDAAPSPRPDAMSYSITMDDGGRSVTLKASDADMSDSFAALLDELQRLDSR